MKKLFLLLTAVLLSAGMVVQAQQVQRISRTSQPKITQMVKHNTNAVQRVESSVAPVQDADRAEAKARHNAPDARVSPRRDAFPSFNYFDHTDGSNAGESFTWAQTTVSYLSNTNTPYYNVRGYKDESTYVIVSETWCFSNNSSYLPSGEYLSANTLAEGTMGIGSSTSDIRSYGGYVDWYDDGTFYIWIFGRSDNTFAWVHNPNHSAKPMYFYSQGASYYNSKTWWTEIGTEPTKYTITFTWGNNGVEDGNDYEADTEEIIFGVEGNTFTMYNQSVFTLTPTPKAGYRFVSWTGTGANEITNNGDGTYRLQMNGKNYSIAAVFEEIPPVDVTLSPNGGSGNDQIVSAMNGSAMPTTLKGGGSIVAPTRTGYVFGGYVANTNGTGRQYYNANLTSANTWDKDVAATIYAKWTAAQYNITYKDQGNANYSGNNAGSLVAKHTYGTPTTLVDGAKNGYTFGGWYENSSCTGEPVTTIGATGKTADFTLYAKWTQNVYHLNLTSGGNGTVSRSDDGTSSTDLHTGEHITLSYTPASGYAFTGWTGNGSSYVTNNVFTVPGGTNGTTYIVQANFAPTHTITVTADPVAGGTVSGGGTYAEGANVTLTATPNSGYSFSRWSDGNTSNPRNVTMGNTDATYTAEFVQQLYDYEYRFNWSTDRVSTDFGQKTSGGSRNSNKWYLLRTNVKKNANSNPGLQIDMTTSQSTGTNGYKSYSNNKLPNPGTYTSTIASVGNNRGYVITSASSGGKTYSTKFTDANGTAHTLSSLNNGKVQYIDVAGQTYPFVYIKGTFTDNKTVFATIGVAPTYTITLDNQSATTAGTESVTAHYTESTNLTSAITIPVKTNYEFGGYYTSTNGGGTQIIDAEGNFIAAAGGNDTYMDAVKRWFYQNNITLYAKWTAGSCTYEVAFDANGGSGTMANQEFTCGEAQNLNPKAFTGPAATITYNYHGATSGNGTPSVTVYKPFGAWEDSEEESLWDDEEEVNFSVSNGATVTMTAQWNAFLGVTLPTPVRTGYTFDGWYTEETGGTKKGNGGANFVPAGSITLHAQWTASNYTITYNAGANGTGAAIANGSKTPGVNFTLSSSTYSREGYTQTGWSTTDGGSKAYDLGGTYSTDANLDLYPFWTANTFTVRFNANGGGSSMGNQNFTYGTSQNLNSNTFTAPTGKHFAGWATSQANANAGTVAYADGARGDQITTSNGVTVDLYAVWTANTYYVSFAANGGSGTMTNQTFTYGVAQNLKANTFTAPTATATFNYNGATGGNSPASATVTATPDGWTWTDDNDQEQYSDEEASVSNLTATNGATVALTANWGWYEDITLPSPTKTGYEFHQWTFTMEEMPMSEDAGAEVPISEDVTMTALWNIVTYNLTYEGLNGASSNNPETYTVETATFALANPDTRTGYTFTGWTCGGNPITQITLGSTGDKTITANWSTNTHNVSWVTDGNTLTGTYTNGTTAYGTTIVAPATPTKTATAQYTYTFNGWTPAVAATMPDNDVTYTATWTETPVNYTLTWTTDGDALTGTYTSGTVAYGTTIVAPATPTKTGYTFAGWDVTPASTMPAANTTYTAQWTVTTYNLTYEGLEGATNNTNPTTYNVESETITLADPGARDGYAFTGWTINGTPVTEITHGSTGDKTITANWNAKLSVITLEDNRENSFYNTFKTTYDGAKGVTVTYARQFTAGRWSTLCLPFNVSDKMYSSLNFGSRIYEFKYAEGNANDNSGVNLYFSIAKSIQAGKGYIVNADDKLAKRTSFVFPGVTINLSADKGDTLGSVTAYNALDGSGATQGNIELVGTLRKGTLAVQEGEKVNTYMGLKGNKIYYPNITSGSTILAYRGIFRSIDREPLNAERIRIIVDGEEKAELEIINGELQDVQETKKFIENGVLYIERNGIIYDATGRKVE